MPGIENTLPERLTPPHQSQIDTLLDILEICNIEKPGTQKLEVYARVKDYTKAEYDSQSVQEKKDYEDAIVNLKSSITAAKRMHRNGSLQEMCPPERLEELNDLINYLS